MSDDVSILEVPERATVAVRHVVAMAGLDMAELFSSTMPRLAGALSGGSARPSGAPYARYFDFGGEKADIEIGLPVDGPTDELPTLAADGAVGRSALPGGRVARYTHHGGYDRLGEAYQELERYLATESLTPSGAPWEEYVVDPESVDHDPERFVTDVSWPIT